MKIQEFAKHLDEPREIGKKKQRLSSSEMRKLKNKAFEFYREGWSDKYKKSINCNNPKGFSQKAHCAGRTKRETIMNLKSLVKETIKEVVTERKLNMFFEENKPTNPSKWSYYKSQAKKKFDVYPSAYANAWAAKQYKAAGGGWKKG